MDTVAPNVGLGIDVGTHTIVVAYRNDKGEIEYKQEVNGFIEMELTPRTAGVYNQLKISGVPIFKLSDGKKFYALGDKAKRFAYSLSSLLSQSSDGDIFKRTMRDGILSSKDSVDSFHVLATMVHGMIGKLITKDNMPVVFSTPGDPTNGGKSTEYHESVIKQILTKCKDGSGKEKKLDAFAMNEGNAIIMAECQESFNTGIGISFGAGMTNLCFSMFGSPIFQFSIVGGGDSIDRGVAEKTGVDPVVANIIKMGDGDRPGIDLLSVPSGKDAHIERAIIMYYDILIQNVAAKFAEYVRKDKARVLGSDTPEVVVAGGTATPNGFIEKLKDEIDKQDMGDFKIRGVRKAENNLYTVAKGLLLYAENAQR